jgi:hypothetical protein
LPAFSARFPRRSPVWRRLAEQGVRSAFVHVPWVFDDQGGVGEFADVAIEAYQSRLAGHDVLVLSEGGDGGTPWPIAGYPVQVEASPGAAVLRAGGTALAISPRDGWREVRLGPGTGFWVLHLGDRLVRTGTWQARIGGADEALARGLSDLPVFAGEGVGPLYRAGIFGPRLADGGSGEAEQGFLSSVDCVVRSFSEAVTAVLAGHHADLVVIYLPWTDDLGHEMAGWCDEQSGAYLPGNADRAWEFLRRGYQQADQVLGQVLSRAAAADTVMLTADHGIAGSTRLLHVNEVLISAGLAARGGAGGLDVARSAVVYHPANNGLLMVNADVVSGKDVTPSMGAAMAALLSRHGAVAGFTDPRGEPTMTPQERMYLLPADDWQPSAAVDGGGEVRPMVKSASHVVNSGDSRLLATFAAMGPGLPAGADLGIVDNTLGALLTCRQFGASLRPGMPAEPGPLAGPMRRLTEAQ